MKVILLAFGIVITLLTVAAIVNPKWLFRMAEYFRNWRAVIFAAVLRFAIGAICLLIASETRFPLAIQIIGVLTITGGLAVLLLGPYRLGQIIDWWARRSELLVRAWMLVGIAFGGFLIYSCI